MIDKIKKGLERFENGYKSGNMFDEYLGFSQIIQGYFISEDGYIIDTGNFQAVNRELIYRIIKKIEKHPILWALFFMVA